MGVRRGAAAAKRREAASAGGTHEEQDRHHRRGDRDHPRRRHRRFSGFVGSGTPEELIAGLEQRFVDGRLAARPDAGVRGGTRRRQGARTQPPRARGLVKRAVGGHWAWCPSSAQWRSTTASKRTTCRSARSRSCSATSPPTAPGTLTKVGPAAPSSTRARAAGASTRARTEDLVRVMRDRRRGVAVLQDLSRSPSRSSAAPPPIRRATSRWNARRSRSTTWRSRWPRATPTAS